MSFAPRILDVGSGIIPDVSVKARGMSVYYLNVGRGKKAIIWMDKLNIIIAIRK